MKLGRDLINAYIEELVNIVGALLAQPATLAPGLPLGGAQWVARVEGDGAEGTCYVAIDAPAAAAVAAALAGCDPADAGDDVVVDTLKEIHSQVAGALSVRPLTRGTRLTVAAIERLDHALPAGDWAVHAISVATLNTAVTVTLWGGLELIDKSAATAPAAAAAAPVAPAAEAAPVPALGQVAASASSPALERIDVILDIDLPLTVRFGRTELPLKALTRLGPGSIIDLGRSPDDPVELVVSNQVVAKGEVVIVSGNYGIRILDVVSQRERMRTMEV
jgi:flagellar motor switch protein FliN